MWNPKKEAEKAAKSLIDKVLKPAGNEIKGGLNKTGDGVRSGIRKAGSEVEGGLKKVGREVEGGIKKAGHEVEDGFKKAGHDIEEGLQQVGREAEDGIRKAAHEVEETFEERIPEIVTEKLPEAMKQLAEDLASEAMKPALKAAAKACKAWHKDMAALAESDPDLVGAIDSCGFKVTLKVNVQLVMWYGGFYTRAQTIGGILDRYANEGIEPRRRDIIGFIEATGPSHVDFGIGAELSLGVEAGAKFELNKVPLKLFTRLGDRGLKAIGVPE